MNRTFQDGEDMILLTIPAFQGIVYLQNGAPMKPEPPYAYMLNGQERNPELKTAVDVIAGESDGLQVVKIDIGEYLQDVAGQVYYRIVGGRPRIRRRS